MGVYWGTWGQYRENGTGNGNYYITEGCLFEGATADIAESIQWIQLSIPIPRLCYSLIG